MVKGRLTGKEVKLVFDKDRYDKYGRTLAYVYLGKTLFNRMLLKEGVCEGSILRAERGAPQGV